MTTGATWQQQQQQEGGSLPASKRRARTIAAPASREEFIQSLTVERLKHYCRLHSVKFPSAARKAALQSLLVASGADFKTGESTKPAQQM